MRDLVWFNNDNYMKADTVTNSINIAEMFGKEHHNVIKKIDKLIEELEMHNKNNDVNFNVVEYLDTKVV